MAGHHDEMTSKGIPTLPAALRPGPTFSASSSTGAQAALSGGDVAEGMTKAQNEAMALVK